MLSAFSAALKQQRLYCLYFGLQLECNRLLKNIWYEQAFLDGWLQGIASSCATSTIVTTVLGLCNLLCDNITMSCSIS